MVVLVDQKTELLPINRGHGIEMEWKYRRRIVFCTVYLL